MNERGNRIRLVTYVLDQHENMKSKCGWSPFDGYKFKGSPVYTIVNGKIKMTNGKLTGEPEGKPIKFDG